MGDLSKEYSLNKLAAALVPDIGHFKDVASQATLLSEKTRMLEIALNADNLDKDTRTALTLEKQMVDTALQWMNAK